MGKACSMNGEERIEAIGDKARRKGSSKNAKT
jgi:hypothetical protein